MYARICLVRLGNGINVSYDNKVKQKTTIVAA